MDVVAALTTMLHSLYIVLLLLTVTMHAVGRHESCRRNATVVSALSIPVLATAMAKAGGELAGILQTLQTVSVFSTLLAGLYMLASWLKTVNDKSFQNTGYSRVDDTYPKTESADSMNEYHYTSALFEGQAPASEQLRKGLDTPSPTSSTAMLQPHSATASEGLGDVPPVRHIGSEVSTTSANITRRATASPHSSEKSRQRTSEGQRLTDSEKRLTEMYVSEIRLLEQAAQRKDRKDGEHRGKTQNVMSLDTLLIYGDYVTIKRLVTHAKKRLREGVIVKGKRYTDRIAYLRFQDWILLYRLRNGPIKKKPPPRQLHRLKSLNLVREEPEAIHLTERGRVVAEAFWMVVKEMSRRTRMTQGNTDENH